jgi:peptide/nickel transport system substrate-binding protein
MHLTKRSTARAPILIAMALALALTACSSTKSPAASSATTAGPALAAATKIITAWPADVTSLDPANLSTNEDHELTRNIYQTLTLPAMVTQKDGSLKFDGAKQTPYLASSWTLGADSITYHLRPGVKFYGTNDVVTAEDVKFSLDRVFSTPGAGDLQANGLQGPDDIHAVDPQTVEIDFKTMAGVPTPVTPTLMAIFDQHFTGIVDENLVMPHETAADPTGAMWLRANTAGTGPYYIAGHVPGSSIVLKAVPDSWLPAPDYREVDIQITTGSISSLIQSHDINFAEYGMTNKQVDDLAKAGHTVYWEDTGNFDMFAMTSSPAGQVGALANTTVRQAIAYALPYGAVLQNIVYGRGDRDLSMVSPSAPEYTPAWSMYTTDLSKATALMQQAGNPKINVPLYYLQGDEDQTNTAILIQANLKQIGITATLTPETQAGLFDVVDARSSPATGTQIGPPGLELFNWSAWTDDPKIVLGYWATTGGINNYALWSSPTVDQINTQYALQPTSPARTAAYQQAQMLIAAAAPYVPIVSTGAITVVDGGIQGVSFSPGGSGRFWTLHPAGTPSQIDSTLFQ